MGKIDWDRDNRPKTQWPEKGFDWTGKDTVPENPSTASAKIVVAGTLAAFFALPVLGLGVTETKNMIKAGITHVMGLTQR